MLGPRCNRIKPPFALLARSPTPPGPAAAYPLSSSVPGILFVSCSSTTAQFYIRKKSILTPGRYVFINTRTYSYSESIAVCTRVRKYVRKRHIIGVQSTRAKGCTSEVVVVCQRNMTALLGKAALSIPGYDCNAPMAPSVFDRHI